MLRQIRNVCKRCVIDLIELRKGVTRQVSPVPLGFRGDSPDMYVVAYLGSTEIVGGKDDGHSQLLGFELDLSRLTESFTKVDEFQWYVGASAEGSNSSFMSVTGSVDDNKICLKVYSRPPKEAGPAFRQHADGSLDPVC